MPVEHTSVAERNDRNRSEALNLRPHLRLGNDRPVRFRTATLEPQTHRWIRVDHRNPMQDSTDLTNVEPLGKALRRTIRPGNRTQGAAVLGDRCVRGGAQHWSSASVHVRTKLLADIRAIPRLR